MINWHSMSAAFAIASGFALNVPVAASAQTSVEAFYKGRSVSVLVGYPPGGSYDLYARLAASQMGRHIPGNPTFVVQNKPGTIGTTRSFYETSPKDGGTLAILTETIGIIQLTTPDTAKWNVREMNYIGSFADVNAAFLLRKGAPAQTLDELRKKPVNVGCNSHVGVAYINPIVMNCLGGFPFNIICGYPGTSSFPIALQRGEIDLVSGTWVAWKNNADVTSGALKPVLQSGLRRHKDMPDVPLMQELITDPESKKIIEFLSAGSAIGRALIAPGGVPADRIAALRGAFDRMVNDKEAQQAAEKMGLELDPTAGEELQKISNAILDTSPAIVQRAMEASK